MAPRAQECLVFTILWLFVLVPHQILVAIASFFSFLLCASLALRWIRLRSRKDHTEAITCAQNGYALVTGASRGMGRHIAKKIAERGYNLILVARSKEKLQAVHDEILDAKPDVDIHVIPWDLSELSSAESLYSEISKKSLSVDILCNAAGIGLRTPISAMAEEQITVMLNTNVHALTSLTRAVLPEMIRRRHGYIVNISSIAGACGAANTAVYSATKAYVSVLSKALAYELQGTGIHLTCAHPGAVDTGFACSSGTTDAVCFNTPFFHHSAENVAARIITAMFRGEDVVPPYGVLNRFYWDIVAPYFPNDLSLFISTTAWGSVRDLPGGIGHFLLRISGNTDATCKSS
eukprot:m.103005 g.103005  ORF g.103005 m.103005 type:complete len:349 (+) comp16833_c0_seq2:291-1337(+)